MSAFARNAVEMLYAAENALRPEDRARYAAAAAAGGAGSVGPLTWEEEHLAKSQRPKGQSHRGRFQDPRSAVGPWTLVEGAAGAGSSSGADGAYEELFRQLGVAMREIADLRAMLMEEREARTSLLVSLGKRWKEELMVEVRGGDLEVRRFLSELEGNIGEQVKSLSTQLQLAQQQIEDTKRHSRVYSSSRMDVEERLRDELEDFKAKLHSATAMCANTRIECTQMLEREKASMSQRLDAELMRYAEMRRADEREVAGTKALLKDEISRLHGTIKGEVQAQWRDAAVALEKTLREPIDELQSAIKTQTKWSRDIESKVENSLHAHEAELRTVSNLLKERIAALESTEAVNNSKVDRVERKCDMVVDTVTKTEAQLKVTRESVESSLAVAQRASERAQHVESIQTDRDSRLCQLESQLKAISTAEALKADVEACRRQVSRVESHVDALRAAAEREETNSERVTRQTESLTSRLSEVERYHHRTQEELKTMNEQSVATAQRIVGFENIVEQVRHTAERQTLAFERVEQRVEAAENRHRVLSESCDQLVKDVHHVQHTFSARIEAAQDIAARAETTSATAKGEVERIEKRVLKIEGLQSTLQANFMTFHSKMDDNEKEINAVQRRQAQNQDWVAGREARLDEKLTLIDDLVATTDSKILKLESKLQSQYSTSEQRTGERFEDIEAHLEEAFKGMNQGISNQLHETQRRIVQQTQEELNNVQSTVNDVQQGLERFVSQSNRDKTQLVTREHIRKLEEYVREREARTQTSMEEIRAAQHQYKGILQNMRTQNHQVQQAIQQIQGDVNQFPPVLSTHERQIEELGKSIRAMDQHHRRHQQENAESTEKQHQGYEELKAEQQKIFATLNEEKEKQKEFVLHQAKMMDMIHESHATAVRAQEAAAAAAALSSPARTTNTIATKASENETRTPVAGMSETSNVDSKAAAPSANVKSPAQQTLLKSPAPSQMQPSAQPQPKTQSPSTSRAQSPSKQSTTSPQSHPSAQPQNKTQSQTASQPQSKTQLPQASQLQPPSEQPQSKPETQPSAQPQPKTQSPSTSRAQSPSKQSTTSPQSHPSAQPQNKTQSQAASPLKSPPNSQPQSKTQSQRSHTNIQQQFPSRSEGRIGFSTSSNDDHAAHNNNADHKAKPAVTTTTTATTPTKTAATGTVTGPPPFTLPLATTVNEHSLAQRAYPSIRESPRDGRTGLAPPALTEIEDREEDEDEVETSTPRVEKAPLGGSSSVAANNAAVSTNATTASLPTQMDTLAVPPTPGVNRFTSLNSSMSYDTRSGEATPTVADRSPLHGEKPAPTTLTAVETPPSSGAASPSVPIRTSTAGMPLKQPSGAATSPYATPHDANNRRSHPSNHHWFSSSSSSSSAETDPNGRGEEERLAASAERPRHRSAPLEDSPPKTLQSLIETASASGRSRSAASQKSARGAGAGGATAPGANGGRSLWDDWDSTDDDEGEAEEDGLASDRGNEGDDDEDEDGVVGQRGFSHIDVYHQQMTADMSHQEEDGLDSDGDDVVIAMEAVLSEPPTLSHTEAAPLFSTVTNQPKSPAVVPSASGVSGTGLPSFASSTSIRAPRGRPSRTSGAGDDDDDDDEEDAVLPVTGEVMDGTGSFKESLGVTTGGAIPRGMVAVDQQSSVRRTTVGGRSSGSGSRSSGGSTQQTTTGSNHWQSQSQSHSGAPGGSRKIYSNFDSSSDEDMHQIH